MESRFGFAKESNLQKRKDELDMLNDIRKLKEKIIKIEKAATSMFESVQPYTGPKIVIYGGDEKCYEDMERSAKMLLANSKIDKIYFLIDTDRFPNPLPDIIEVINVHDQAYFQPWSPSLNLPVPYMTLMRHAMYDMFPQYDRVLWLDGDTLIMDDISEIFNTPMGDFYYFAGTKEDRHYLKYLSTRKAEDVHGAYHDLIIDRHNYINAGVLLMNLKLIREDQLGERLVNRINNYRIFYPDQTIINEQCMDRIYYLDCEWNTSHFTDEAKMPRIIHMSSCDRTELMKETVELYNKVTFDEVMKLRQRREKAGVLNGKK